jgi:hypothetical protein
LAFSGSHADLADTLRLKRFHPGHLNCITNGQFSNPLAKGKGVTPIWRWLILKFRWRNSCIVFSAAALFRTLKGSRRFANVIDSSEFLLLEGCP